MWGGIKPGSPCQCLRGPRARSKEGPPFGHGKDPPRPWEGPSSAINVAKGKGSNSVLVMTFWVISPNRKSTKTTKNKGKTVITAIKYSEPDRVMPFSFYNHPQPLWVWADGTSTSPIKLNLHVNVGGKEKASIKGGRSSPERKLGLGPRTGATQAVSRRKSSWISLVHLCAIIMNTMTNDCPFTKV